MTTRDLTARFAELREYRFGLGPASRTGRGSDSVDSTQSHGSGLLQNPGAIPWGGSSQLPPMWVDKFEAVEEVLRNIQLRMRDLSALHSKRLMVTFDGSEGDKEREIEAATQEITNLFRGAERQLKSAMAGAGSADARVRSNIQKATARKIQNLSLAFRSSQKGYLVRLQAQKGGGDDFEFLARPEGGESGKSGGSGSGSYLSQAQLEVLEDTHALVAERDEEIRHVAKNIEELGTIFKELAVLVIDQGTVLDRIDFNMEQVVEHAQEGVEQLRKAEEAQKSAIPSRIIACLLVLIFIMIAMLIWKHSK
ncbi:unnamed protein product [Chrysoparadoxa australica]